MTAWKVEKSGKGWEIWDGDEPVVRPNSRLTMENARLIVRAVNAHQALRESALLILHTAERGELARALGAVSAALDKADSAVSIKEGRRV